MAAVNSTEYAKVVGFAAQSYAPLKPREMEGRLRVAYFSLNTTTTPVASGDTVNLVKLPIGARVLFGKFAHDALSGTATISIGDSVDAVRYLAAGTVVTPAGNTDFATTIAQNTGHVIDVAGKQVIFVTNAVAGWTAAKTLKGYIVYVVD